MMSANSLTLYKTVIECNSNYTHVYVCGLWFLSDIFEKARSQVLRCATYVDHMCARFHRTAEQNINVCVRVYSYKSSAHLLA